MFVANHVGNVGNQKDSFVGEMFGHFLVAKVIFYRVRERKKVRARKERKERKGKEGRKRISERQK